MIENKKFRPRWSAAGVFWAVLGFGLFILFYLRLRAGSFDLGAIAAEFCGVSRADATDSCLYSSVVGHALSLDWSNLASIFFAMIGSPIVCFAIFVFLRQLKE